jgi:hypothetical protein
MLRIGLEEPNSLNHLYYPSGRNNGRDTELHQSASTRSQNDPGPVEGVTGVGSLYAEKRDLRADEVDEEGNGGIDGFLVNS